MEQLVRDTAGVMQEYTQRGGVRPFGVSLLVAGDDDDGPQLYQVDPSGAYFGWKATAIGKNFVNAKNFLEKRYEKHFFFFPELSSEISFSQTLIYILMLLVFFHPRLFICLFYLGKGR